MTLGTFVRAHLAFGLLNALTLGAASLCAGGAFKR
jgi:hypothetical protein